MQTYAYAYDTNGRLTSGTHGGGNSETAAYDANGNLTSLTRTGSRAETLVYTYTSGTNKLGTLKSNGTSKTYAYYSDGTMKTDGLRGLTVTYNALKLPKTLGNTTSTVTYIYDAEGNKLSVSQGGTVRNIYCGEFIYNASLAVDYIQTPNGQMTRNPSTGTYAAQYNITDHLGNVRSVVNSSGTVLQSTDYYPFGLAFSDANITNNRYLYNGKELENYTIGSSYLGTLDYGARHYDARIGRWTVPDPMAEKYYGLNAFNYCAGNPIYLIDSNGKEWRENKGKITVSLNFSASEQLSNSQINDYKLAIQNLFNKMIVEVSGGAFTGEIDFHNNDPDIVQSLSLDYFADNNIGGTTSRMSSIVNIVGKDGSLASPMEVAQSTIHELLHTVRLDHPFETAQVSDTKLINNGKNSFITTSTTDPNIANNIMNYSFIVINGQRGSDLTHLTKGQFDFIRKEIMLQRLGYGFFKYNSSISNNRNLINYAIYQWYWENIPGTPIHSL